MRAPRWLLRLVERLYTYWFLDAWCPAGHGNIDRMPVKAYNRLSAGHYEVVCPKCPHPGRDAL